MAVIHWKAVAYAATSFAATMMNSVFGFYYVKIYLGRFGVEESWFDIAQIIFMVWNAVNDPLFGYIQDNYSFSLVKSRRHSILYGAPLFILSFLVPWFPWDPTGTSVWIPGCQLLFSLCFYDTMFTFVLLAQCALFTELSYKQEDRMRLVRYGQLANLLGSGTVYFCEKVSHNLDYFHAFQMCCVLIACISFLSLCYTGFRAKTALDLDSGSEQIDKRSQQNIHEEEGILRMTCQIITQKNFVSFVLMNFCQIYSNVFSDNFASIICDRLIPKDQLSSSLRSTFYGSLFVLPPLAVIVGGSTVVRFGYYQVIKISFIIIILSCLSLFISGPSTASVILYFIVIRVCTSGAFSLFNLSLSDIIDEDKNLFQRRHRLSAMVYGTNALITKPAISLAPMITVGILNRHGYEKIKNVSSAGSTDLVNPDLDHVMFQLLVWTPFVMASLQLLIWSFYTIRNSHKTDAKYADVHASADGCL